MTPEQQQARREDLAMLITSLVSSCDGIRYRLFNARYALDLLCACCPGVDALVMPDRKEGAVSLTPLAIITSVMDAKEALRDPSGENLQRCLPGLAQVFARQVHAFGFDQEGYQQWQVMMEDAFKAIPDLAPKITGDAWIALYAALTTYDGRSSGAVWRHEIKGEDPKYRVVHAGSQIEQRFELMPGLTKIEHDATLEVFGDDDESKRPTMKGKTSDVPGWLDALGDVPHTIMKLTIDGVQINVSDIDLGSTPEELL